MAKKRKLNKIHEKNDYKFAAIKSQVLDVVSYRGFAKLSELAAVSNADIYNTKDNPNGIQREINKKHAREAYEYASKTKPSEKRLWPELILNIRDPKLVKIVPFKGAEKIDGVQPVLIRIDLKKSGYSVNTIDPTISRVDGNHRLYFASGKINPKKFPPLDSVTVPFSMTEGLDLAEEAKIFKTINEQQYKLKVDYILNLVAQLTPEPQLRKKDPSLWITQKLVKSKNSPFAGSVFIAGKKEKGKHYTAKQKSIYDAVKIIYTGLPVVQKTEKNLQPLAEIMISYFNAVKKKWHSQWNDNKNYLLMTSTGLHALGLMGASLISEQIYKHQIEEEDFVKELKKSKFLWSNKRGDEKIPTGRQGAELIAKRVMGEITTNVNLRSLVKGSK